MMLSPLPCPACGACAVPTLGPGTGPHAARALCPQCGRFLQWLPKSLVAKEPAMGCLVINKVFLAGHISKYGVTIRYNQVGTAYATFTLVMTEQGADHKTHATFVDCEVWGRHAEEVGELEAGQLALFEGKLAKRKKGDQWELIVSGYDVTPVLPAQATLTGSPQAEGVP